MQINIIHPVIKVIQVRILPLDLLLYVLTLLQRKPSRPNKRSIMYVEMIQGEDSRQYSINKQDNQ